MKNINASRSTFLKFGDYIQRKGHMDKEMDSRQIKNIDGSNSLYLTFDFCPSSEIDKPVIDWLIDNKIEATLFISREWMVMNEGKDMSFIDNPLFTIGGHGFNHIDPLEESDDEQLKDIDLALEFWKKNKKDIHWYRVPYGHPTDAALQKFHKLGIQCASWSGPVLDKKSSIVDTNTYETAKDFVNNYLRSGDLLVAHANGEGIKTLDIVKLLKDKADSLGLVFKSLK